MAETQRLIRKTAILAKLETTYGVDAIPTCVANALVVSNVSINPLNAEWIKRDVIREYLGASEELAGATYSECGFDVELVGAGAAGKAPAWGPLMRSIGFAEIITLTASPWRLDTSTVGPWFIRR